MFAPIKTEVGGFLNELARQFPVVVLELIDTREHFIVHKLPRRLGNHAVLFSEVFGCKNLFRRCLLNEKRASLDYFFCSTAATIIPFVLLTGGLN